MAIQQGRLTSVGHAAPHPKTLVAGAEATYETQCGAAFRGHSVDLMREIPSGSVHLIVTSPPYALHFPKEYGNVAKRDYVDWFLPFGREMPRVLADDGSLILNIGGSYNAGEPTRSLYHFRLLIELCDTVGFRLAQELFWYMLSARRADRLVREKLFDRVFALRVPGFARAFRGAELDMHFSLSEDLTPLPEFLAALRDRGPQAVSTILERGDY